jgi:hypothetical protein
MAWTKVCREALAYGIGKFRGEPERVARYQVLAFHGDLIFLLLAHAAIEDWQLANGLEEWAYDFEVVSFRFNSMAVGRVDALPRARSGHFGMKARRASPSCGLASDSGLESIPTKNPHPKSPTERNSLQGATFGGSCSMLNRQ